MTVMGRRWYRRLIVTLRRGKSIAVGSFIPVGTAKAIMIYSIMIASMMKRMTARRFLGVVQWNMRRLRGWVVIVVSLVWVFCL